MSLSAPAGSSLEGDEPVLEVLEIHPCDHHLLQLLVEPSKLAWQKCLAIKKSCVIEGMSCSFLEFPPKIYINRP